MADDMTDNEEAVFAAALALVSCVMIIVGGSLLFTAESISITALDNMCKQVTADPDAHYHKEFGRQKNVPCVTGDRIILLNKKQIKVEGENNENKQDYREYIID